MKTRVISGTVALLGLWGWEAFQRLLPKAVFDWHDVVWTVPGVVVAYVVTMVFVPSGAGDAQWHGDGVQRRVEP